MMQVHDLIAEAYQNGHVYHGFINALIGAGASILGGLFGRKKAKPQVQETITDQTSTSSSSVDFAKMSADAQAAGFNPLTAIRSGAIGGYVTSTTRTQGKNVTTTTGGGGGEPNAFGVIADGIGQMAAGGLFGSFNTPKNDPIKVRNKSTGEIRSVVGAQLGSTRRAGSVVVAPRQTTVRSPVTRTRPATTTRLAPYLEDGKLTNTDVGKQFDWWESDPSRVDGAQYEDAYGEFIGGALGIVPFFQDAWHNAKRGKAYASDAWQRQKIASNYRTMAKRPVVDNRRPPPAGYRYAD